MGLGERRLSPRASRRAKQRIVLLGASNLVRAFPVILRQGRRIWGGPLDVVAAIGHGRSYGRASCVLGRTLPSIRACRLWGALRRRPPVATAALVTDVGNDLLYDRRPEQIVAWVSACIKRLLPVTRSIVVTELPLDSISSLGPLRFLALRSLLYPLCRITLPVARARAHETNQRLAELARQHELSLIRPRRQWYGFDPVHIRYGQMERAWGEILDPWKTEAVGAGTPLMPGDRSRLRRARAELRYWFGVRCCSKQPSASLIDGSTILLF